MSFQIRLPRRHPSHKFKLFIFIFNGAVESKVLRSKVLKLLTINMYGRTKSAKYETKGNCVRLIVRELLSAPLKPLRRAFR